MGLFRELLFIMRRSRDGHLSCTCGQRPCSACSRTSAVTLYQSLGFQKKTLPCYQQLPWVSQVHGKALCRLFSPSSSRSLADIKEARRLQLVRGRCATPQTFPDLAGNPWPPPSRTCLGSHGKLYPPSCTAITKLTDNSLCPEPSKGTGSVCVCLQSASDHSLYDESSYQKNE